MLERVGTLEDLSRTSNRKLVVALVHWESKAERVAVTSQILFHSDT